MGLWLGKLKDIKQQYCGVGHKYLYPGDTRRIKVSTGSTANIPSRLTGLITGITGCNISLITFDLAALWSPAPQLFIKMTDLLRRAGLELGLTRPIFTIRAATAGSLGTIKYILPSQETRPGMVIVKYTAAWYRELTRTRHASHFQFLPFSHFPEYDVFSPCLTSIHSPGSLSGLSN